MVKKPAPQNRKSFTTGILRRASFQWKARTEAMMNARVSRGRYKCAACEELFGPKEIALDHINPVVDPKLGFTTFDDYIEKLFCNADGFQVLCHADHDAKTKIEDSMREYYKTQKETLPKLKNVKKTHKNEDGEE